MIVTSQATQSVAFFAAEKMVGVIAYGTGNGIHTAAAPDFLDADQGGAGEIDGVAVFRAGDDITIPTTAIDYLDHIFPREVMDPDGIIAAAAEDFIFSSGSAVEDVVGGIFADNAEDIVTGATNQGVLAFAAFQVVVAAVAPDGVVAAHAIEVITFIFTF